MKTKTGLSQDRQEHLEEMQAEFLKLSTEKYVKGQEEHGGKMWLKPGMLQHLKEELVDAWHYVTTLEMQLKDRQVDDVINWWADSDGCKSLKDK